MRDELLTNSMEKYASELVKAHKGFSFSIKEAASIKVLKKVRDIYNRNPLYKNKPELKELVENFNKVSKPSPDGSKVQMWNYGRDLKRSQGKLFMPETSHHRYLQTRSGSDRNPARKAELNIFNVSDASSSPRTSVGPPTRHIAEDTTKSTASNESLMSSRGNMRGSSDLGSIIGYERVATTGYLKPRHIGRVTSPRYSHSSKPLKNTNLIEKMKGNKGLPRDIFSDLMNESRNQHHYKILGETSPIKGSIPYERKPINPDTYKVKDFDTLYRGETNKERISDYNSKTPLWGSHIPDVAMDYANFPQKGHVKVKAKSPEARKQIEKSLRND